MNCFVYRSVDLFISAFLGSFASLTTLTLPAINELIHFKPSLPHTKASLAIFLPPCSFIFQSLSQGSSADLSIQDSPKNILHLSFLRSTISLILVSQILTSIPLQLLLVFRHPHVQQSAFQTFSTKAFNFINRYRKTPTHHKESMLEYDQTPISGISSHSPVSKWPNPYFPSSI